MLIKQTHVDILFFICQLLTQSINNFKLFEKLFFLTLNEFEILDLFFLCEFNKLSTKYQLIKRTFLIIIFLFKN